MKHFILLTSILFFDLLGSFAIAQEIKSPSDFLGYSLGSKFTYHHKVVDYFKYVDDRSKKVKIQSYGSTYEHRELQIAIISSEENIRNLDNIRTDNLKRAGFLEEKGIETEIPIIWLSYNVHGNEANSTETAMKVLYNLATNKDARYRDWLEKLIVIVDPCLNPDGRERYINWYNQVSNFIPNPNLNSREHHEGWSSGRTNHYLFDLNRDWVWQTQLESRLRLLLYHEWMPQVHVDFHEQFPNSQYYFAPAAEPMHEHVTAWQKEFQEIVGKYNSKYFDEKGWLYFSRESFDLLYPGYGDTYPTFNGAIGMTYEMPGHGIAGLAIETQKGDTLTLSKRMDMHYTSSISTIEACYENHKNLLQEFAKYFNSDPAENRTYIIKSDQFDKITLLIDLLEKNKILFKSIKPAKKPATVQALSYTENEIVDISIDKNDLIVPISQPKSKMVKVLFERNTTLVDSLTYDITAWSLPFVYGLEAYKTSQDIELVDYELISTQIKDEEDNAYAYVLNWASILDARFLSDILQNGIKINYATKAFSFKNRDFSPGSLIVNRIDNSKVKFEQDLIDIANEHQQNLIPLYSGSSIPTFDLGSNNVKYLSKPRIALLAGGDVSSYNFGEVWYFFEQELKYPVDVVEMKWFENVDVDDYDVIILPSGKYKDFESEDSFKMIEKWVIQGGRLILFQDAIDRFIGESRFSLEKIEDEKDKDKNEEPVLYPFNMAERESLKKNINGGIIKLEFDNSHPLAYGYGKTYYSLKTSTKFYKFLEDGWNVGYIKSPNSTVAGFVGSKTKKDLNDNLIFGVEKKDKGQVIYIADNPIFRGFWQDGKLILANAIFFCN